MAWARRTARAGGAGAVARTDAGGGCHAGGSYHREHVDFSFLVHQQENRMAPAAPTQVAWRSKAT